MLFKGLYTGSFVGLSSTGTYFSQIVNSVSPTVNFLYDNLLTNPIFYGLILVILVLSVITFSD